MNRRLVPESLEIDLHDGKAWVSLVAFSMENIRPRGLPALLGISYFDEINIRTYVRHGNKTGVYFLSIEAGNIISVKVSKIVSGLPYRYSNMSRESSQFKSSNAQFKDEFKIRFTAKDELTEKSTIDLWLIERYALYQDSLKGLNRFEIHHIEWPITDIEIKELGADYPRFKYLLSGSPDKQHFSSGVQVLTWGKQIEMANNLG